MCEAIKYRYRISSKSRCGEILFQGSIWGGDNSRAARFRRRRLKRLKRMCVHSFNNKPNCMHVKCPCAYGNCCQPLTMRRDFKGGVHWDELANRCGDISRAAGFRGAARFQANTGVQNLTIAKETAESLNDHDDGKCTKKVAFNVLNSVVQHVWEGDG